MLCLYTSCLGFLGSQNGANTRPFLSALTSRSLQAVRVTPANRSTLQQGRRGVSHLSTAKSIVCQAATPQSTKLDSSMIWGDIMMLTATELASERLPKQVTGVLSLTLLAAWIGVGTYIIFSVRTVNFLSDISLLPQVAAAKGDYTVSKRRHSLSFEYAYAILLGMQQAAITWVRSCFHMGF